MRVEGSQARPWLVPVVLAGVLVGVHSQALLNVHFLWDGWAWQACALEWSACPLRLWDLDPSYSFRPLARAYYLALFSLFGPEPRGYLAANLVLHGAACWTAGNLMFRVLGNRPAATAVTIFMALLPAATEAVQWIAAFPHLLLGLLVLLFLREALLFSAEGGRGPALRGAGLLVAAALTREPWILAAPLTAVTLLWAGGLRLLFKPRGVAAVAVPAVLSLAYLALFPDLLGQERVPGGEECFGLGLDGPARLFATLPQLFLTRLLASTPVHWTALLPAGTLLGILLILCRRLLLHPSIWAAASLVCLGMAVPGLYEAVLARLGEPVGGIFVLSVLVSLAAVRGREALGKASGAVFFLVIALLPYSFYRDQFLASRYLYLAVPGAILLAWFAAQGAGTLAMRWGAGKVATGILPGGLLLIWALLAFVGVRQETAQRFSGPWAQSRAMERELLSVASAGEPFMILNLPDPHEANWAALVRARLPGRDAKFHSATTRQALVSAWVAADQIAAYWYQENEQGGCLTLIEKSQDGQRFLQTLEPVSEWGVPTAVARRVWGVLSVGPAR